MQHPSQQSPMFPIINQLNVSSSIKNLYAQLYNQQHQIPQRIQQQSYSFPMSQSQFITPYHPGYQQSQLISQIQYPQSSLNIPIPQFNGSIQFGYDLSEFGIPNEPPKQRITIPKAKFRSNKFYKPPPEEFPADFLDRIELPRIMRAPNFINSRVAPIMQNQQFNGPYDETVFQDQGEIMPKKISKKKKKAKKEKVTKKDKNKAKKKQLSVDDSFNEQFILDDKEEVENEQGAIESKDVSSKLKRKQKWWKTNDKRLRIFKFRLLFLGLYMHTLKQNVLAKQIIQSTLIQDITADAFDASTEWMENALHDLLLELLNMREDLGLQIAKDSDNNRKKEQVKIFLMKSVDALTKNYNSQTMGKEYFEFLIQTAVSYRFPPQEYYFIYEINRLMFTRFGSLWFLESLFIIKVRMVIIMFVFIRNYLFATVMKAWQFHPNQENTEHLFLIQRNSIIITSVLHEIIITQLESKVKEVYQDDDEIPQDKRIRPRPAPLTDDTKEYLESGKAVKEEVLIDNILAPSVSQRYIIQKNKQQEKWVIELWNKIIILCDKIIDDMKIIEKEEQSSIAKERMITKMLYIDQSIKKNRLKRK